MKVKEFYEKEICRKLNWRTQIYRRQSEDLFLNNIEKTFGKKEDIAIVYGDWSRDAQMKYHVPTIGKKLRKLRCTITTANVFYQKKIYSHDNSYALFC